MPKVRSHGETFLCRYVTKRLTIGKDLHTFAIRKRIVWHCEVVRLGDLHVAFSAHMSRNLLVC